VELAVDKVLDTILDLVQMVHQILAAAAEEAAAGMVVKHQLLMLVKDQEEVVILQDYQTLIPLLVKIPEMEKHKLHL
jgi:hypothetical protein